MAWLKNTASLPCGKPHVLTYARSAHQCSTFQKLTFLQLLHFKEGLFSAAKMARLKNTASLPCGKPHVLCVRYRARIEQLPKLILCSVVQF